jgi:hypothetical protein
MRPTSVAEKFAMGWIERVAYKLFLPSAGVAAGFADPQPAYLPLTVTVRLGDTKLSWTQWR